MTTPNTPALTAIAPVAPRSPATQDAPQKAGQDGKPTFAQVLKSRSQASEAPKPAASKPTIKAENTPDKTETSAEVAEAPSATATQTNNLTTIDPAVLLAAAGVIPATAATSLPVATSIQHDSAAIIMEAGAQVPLLASPAAATAAQAASIAGKTNNAADSALRSQAGPESSSKLTGRGEDTSFSGLTEEKPKISPEAIKAGPDPLAETLSTSPQTEKSASFATELATASQSRDVSTGTPPPHSVLSGPQNNRSGEVLPRHEISTSVATRGWAEEVGQKVRWIASHDNGRAEIVLTPPSMGRVEISISLSGDQASATFITATPAAREALQDAMPRLREVLAQSGIQLGQANVNEGSTQQHAQPDNQGRRGPASLFASPVESGTPPVGTLSGGWAGRGSGAIDTFA